MKRGNGISNRELGHAGRGPEKVKIRNPESALRNTSGFTYLALLAAIVIIGIILGGAGKYWSNVMLREKEEELLFRGDQYRKAIRLYTQAMPGVVRAPSSIDDLLSDSKGMGKRYLRKKYKDPVSGEDFVEVFAVTGGQVRRLIGVHSPSDKEPLKQSNFPEEYKDFEGKKKYSEWKFTYQPGEAPPPRPVGMGSGG